MVSLILASKERQTTARLRRRSKTQKGPRKTRNSPTPRDLVGSKLSNPARSLMC